LVKKALRRPQNAPNCTIYFKIFSGFMPPDPPRLFWIHILYRLATRLLQYTLYLYVVGFSFKDLANKVNTVLILCVISSPERGEISWPQVVVKTRISQHPESNQVGSQSEHIGQCQATPHHLSDVRRGAPSWIWDYFSHSDVTICLLNAIYMLYFARSAVWRNWPNSSDCVLFKMFR